MKKKYLTLLFLGLACYSCQKSAQLQDSGWNALAFTESKSTNYTDYMNEAHINITFPSKTKAKNIVYENGIWKDDDKMYVFNAHNWVDEEIILHIYKDHELFKELTLKPKCVYGKELEKSLKDFSMNYQPPIGEYSFQISIKDHRGSTLLNGYSLHGGANKMVVH